MDNPAELTHDRRWSHCRGEDQHTERGAGIIIITPSHAIQFQDRMHFASWECILHLGCAFWIMCIHFSSWVCILHHGYAFCIIGMHLAPWVCILNHGYAFGIMGVHLASKVCIWHHKCAFSIMCMHTDKKHARMTVTHAPKCHSCCKYTSKPVEFKPKWYFFLRGCS